MKQLLIVFGLVLVGSTSIAVLGATPAQAAACPDGKILTLKPWYDGLVTSECHIKTVTGKAESSNSGSEVTLGAFVWRIVLNIVDDLLQISGFIAVGFMIYGGFLYMTSNGEADRMTSGLKTVLHAAIGLVIAISAIGLVNLVADGMGLPR